MSEQRSAIDAAQWFLDQVLEEIDLADPLPSDPDGPGPVRKAVTGKGKGKGGDESGDDGHPDHCTCGDCIQAERDASRNRPQDFSDDGSMSDEWGAGW